MEMKRNCIAILVILGMMVGCLSSRPPPPYIAEIWQAGDARHSNGPGWKGGSVPFEQIVLLDNGEYCWTQTRCGLMPRLRCRFSKKGNWKWDMAGSYLLSGTNRIYVAQTRAEGGSPYETNHFVRMFAARTNTLNHAIQADGAAAPRPDR